MTLFKKVKKMNEKCLIKRAEQLSGLKAKEVTTNFIYFCKTTVSSDPQKIPQKIAFYMAIILNSFWALIPQINKRGIIYIPRIYFFSEYLSIRFLVHELHHLHFPEMEEGAVVGFTLGVMKEWKQSQQK